MFWPFADMPDYAMYSHYTLLQITPYRNNQSQYYQIQIIKTHMSLESRSTEVPGVVVIHHKKQHKGQAMAKM